MVIGLLTAVTLLLSIAAFALASVAYWKSTTQIPSGNVKVQLSRNGQTINNNTQLLSDLSLELQQLREMMNEAIQANSINISRLNDFQEFHGIQTQLAQIFQALENNLNQLGIQTYTNISNVASDIQTIQGNVNTLMVLLNSN